jgi:hypothetical protein
MTDEEYLKKVAEMLYHFNVHRIIADGNSEYLNKLSKLAQSKRFRKVYQIFARCSRVETPLKILQIIKNQLGITADENFNYLLDLPWNEILDWFVERHDKNKVLACGTYWLHCRATEDTYLGCSMHIERRLKHHKYLLDNFMHQNPKLQRLWLDYGEKDFDFVPLKFTTDYKVHERTMIAKLKGFFPLINCQQRSCYARCRRNVFE